jgi:hypothetical protein
MAETGNPVERKRGAISYGGLAQAQNEYAKAFGSDIMGGMAIGASQPESAPRPLAGVMDAANRSGHDPVRTAAEDSMLMQSRDDMMFAQLSRPPRTQDANPGALPHQVYYPNANDPIIKGYMSHPMIGNQPLFAASGGLMPVGMLDARRQVVAESAQRQAQRQGAKNNKVEAVEAYAPVKSKINNAMFGWASRYYDKGFEKRGTFFNDLIDDENSDVGLEFKAGIQKFQDLGGLTTFVSEEIDTKRKAIMDGGQVATPDNRRLLDNYHNGIREAFDRIGPNAEPKDLEDVEKQLMGYLDASVAVMNMAKVYDDRYASLKTDLMESSPELGPVLRRMDEGQELSTEDLRILRTYEKEFMNPKRINTFVDEIMRDYGVDLELSDPVTAQQKGSEKVFRDRVQRELEARFPDRVKRSYTTHRNDQGGSKGGVLGGSKIDMFETSANDIARYGFLVHYGGDKIKDFYNLYPPKGGNPPHISPARVTGARFVDQDGSLSMYNGHTTVKMDLPQHVFQGTMDGREGWFLVGETYDKPVGGKKGESGQWGSPHNVIKRHSDKRQVILPLTQWDPTTKQMVGTTTLDALLAVSGSPMSRAEAYQKFGVRDQLLTPP